MTEFVVKDFNLNMVITLSKFTFCNSAKKIKHQSCAKIIAYNQGKGKNKTLSN